MIKTSKNVGIVINMDEIEFLRFSLKELYNMIDVIEKRIGVLKRKKENDSG